MKQWLIFTDLDGTLLDHNDYSFDAAGAALQQLRALHLPLILASSKTRLEMEQIRAQLQLDYPFICENGAAICTPAGAGLEVEALAPPRSRVLDCLAALREAEGYRFTGFNDASVAEIVAMTGLSPAAAELAAAREYSEPLLWQDSAERLAQFRVQLAAESLQALQGGRFLSIAGCSDKATALRRVRERYAGDEGSWVVALGDSPNDESMLAAADVAVIVASAQAPQLQLPPATRIIRTAAPGPAGWQEAMSVLLQEYTMASGET